MSTATQKIFTLALAGLLVACGTPPVARQTVYDFGPGALQALPAAAGQTAIVLLEVEAPPALDGTALLYRLGYHDAQQLQPYALARWSMPPAQLLRQRARDQLGQQRAVLSMTDGGAAQALVLRLELEEFSQLFDTPAHSQALVRVRATLSQTGAKGHVLAQTTLVQQSLARSADAAGGAQALSRASDALVLQLDQWLAANSPAP